MKKWQFVNWFPQWKGLFIWKPKAGMKFIYKYSLVIGFFELRRWVNS